MNTIPGEFARIIKPVIVDKPSTLKSSAHTTGRRLMYHDPMKPFKTENTTIAGYDRARVQKIICKRPPKKKEQKNMLIGPNTSARNPAVIYQKVYVNRNYTL